MTARTLVAGALLVLGSTGCASAPGTVWVGRPEPLPARAPAEAVLSVRTAAHAGVREEEPPYHGFEVLDLDGRVVHASEGEWHARKAVALPPGEYLVVSRADDGALRSGAQTCVRVELRPRSVTRIDFTRSRRDRAERS